MSREYTGPLERLDESRWRIPKSYKPGMTVAEFLKAGGWRADLRWDAKQGFIAVGKPS